MHKLAIISLVMTLTGMLSSPALAVQDTLAKVKQKGVLVAA